ncbi:protein of unknown function DUF955 [Alkaliphilus metalliredigens QYMF]|uniref:IrrE N-terminal-like domain-containing protein n=1 Tax=Alkaliphilus metalliredigens (strain QYMF) TaxID=293826 RepID=A6TQS2_ALKMQ|nr:ImmA/IrrE family metallo-endopeptidase [Alkaliphilus metalliredigens]ABR48540.1 protein of unknown function DUF955 [Alkaliphilus metalliredigens QYMF]
MFTIVLAHILPQTNINYLEEKANFILDKHTIKYSFETNIYCILDQYRNIKVFHLNQGSKTIIKKNKAIILLDSQLPPREERQELAEEFCHALLHLGNQIDNTTIIDKQENQAKRMAAYLLCPIHIIKNISVPSDTYAMIDELADVFFVTPEFMKYRLSLIWGQDIDMVSYHNGQAYGFMTVGSL